jgi:CubicO group peptidase (beta-lactamase class C family)
MESSNLKRALKYIDLKSNKSIADCLSPGIVVGVTNIKKNLLLNGYGLNNIKQRTLMYPDTILLLASVSKSISGAAVSVIQKKYPYVNIIERKTHIQMSDMYVSKHLTVKDLISHRSGILRQYGTANEMVGYSRKEIIRNLEHVPNKGFRDTYNYTNLPFTEGIEIAFNTVNMTLKEGYQYLFDLIGMSESSIDYEPYKYRGYVNTRLLGPTDDILWFPSFKYNVTEQVSAGGIYSSANDLNKFMRFHLEQLLLPDDDKLIDPLFYQGVFVKGSNNIASLGINITYQNVGERFVKMFSHSGALENVRTTFTFSSDLDIGIFVATNSCPNGVPEALIRSFFLILGGGSFEDADILFDKTQKETIQLLLLDLPRLSYDVKGIRIYNSYHIAGLYISDIYQSVKIKKNGTIKIGNLNAVDLFKVDHRNYQFLLYDKAQLPIIGSFVILNDRTIKLTYYAEIGIYKLVKC